MKLFLSAFLGYPLKLAIFVVKITVTFKQVIKYFV